MGSLPSAADGYSKPLGIRFVEYIKRSPVSFRTHQSIVLIVTFLAYACYNANWKTTSIVKSTLDPASSEVGSKFQPWRRGYFLSPPEGRNVSGPLGSDGGWAPFDGSDGTELLSDLDVAFPSAYAVGTYCSGHLGDRTNLRIFLTVGMMGTVVNWFGKSKRGLIMGIWNAHTSVGSIMGTLVASAMSSYGWGWSFVVPGLIIAFMGLAVFFFLPVSPESVGADRDDDLNSPKKNGEEVREPLLSSDPENKEKAAVGFIEAWKIPGVAPFAFCLFFAKLVSYTFIYWLPFYISDTAIDGEYSSSETAGDLSTLFDVGGVIGGILAGYISDRLGTRAITAASFMYFAIPALFLYRCYGSVSLSVNITLMLIAGIFVNGPNSLITTAVSADLGTRRTLKGNSRALATVTAIINGTGSIGAALRPLLTGYISAESWGAVFAMLMAASLIGGLLLTKLIVAEVAAKIEESRL